VRRPGPEDRARAEAILARARRRRAEDGSRSLRRETVCWTDPEAVDVTVQALRIGELGIVAIPCEVFAEIGLELKAQSPLRPTFTIELANGYNGYLPTKAQHALGGYETWRRPLELPGGRRRGEDRGPGPGAAARAQASGAPS
jgi:hypothetical protein